jgi:hypothetical protein
MGVKPVLSHFVDVFIATVDSTLGVGIGLDVVGTKNELECWAHFPLLLRLQGYNSGVIHNGVARSEQEGSPVIETVGVTGVVEVRERLSKESFVPQTQLRMIVTPIPHLPGAASTGEFNAAAKVGEPIGADYIRVGGVSIVNAKFAGIPFHAIVARDSGGFTRIAWFRGARNGCRFFRIHVTEVASGHLLVGELQPHTFRDDGSSAEASLQYSPVTRFEGKRCAARLEGRLCKDGQHPVGAVRTVQCRRGSQHNLHAFDVVVRCGKQGGNIYAKRGHRSKAIVNQCEQRTRKGVVEAAGYDVRLHYSASGHIQPRNCLQVVRDTDRGPLGYRSRIHHPHRRWSFEGLFRRPGDGNNGRVQLED